MLHMTVVLAQQVTISGQVLDEKSEPLIGATVNIEGTTNAVITDLEGKFTLKALPSEKIVISYLGYKPKTVAIGKNRKFNITLDPSVTEMDEIVVVGYGSQRKSDIATAVASVNIKDIAKSSSAQTLQALQGKISGVQIIPTDGSLSSGMTFRIRGVNSITGGTQPLFVIDGVPMPTQQITNEDTETVNNPLLGLNPNDIESMEILKDAAAAAIYGAKGANGVVIITTKRGAVIFIIVLQAKMKRESYSWKVVGRITVLWESIMKTGWWRISLKNWLLRENGTMIKKKAGCIIILYLMKK